MVKQKGARRGRPPLGLERVKWTPRVDPVDAATFRRIRLALMASERRRVSDADVFRLAVRALVGSLPAAVEGGSKTPVRRRQRSG